MKRSLNPDEVNSQLVYEFDRGSNYESVLNLTQALSALVPESETDHPDQRFFQVTHLISEYAWVQIHYELRRVKEHLDNDRCQQAVRLLERSRELSEITINAVRMLSDHLPQHSLLMMRNSLPEDATGLDSPGYRNLRRVARPLWKSFEQAMDRAGCTAAELISVQNDAADSEKSSQQAQSLALVWKAMLRFDSSVLGWKKSHLIMVWAQLGGQPGLRHDNEQTDLPRSLGGRSVSTMESRSDFALFPELWRAAEQTYWALGTRHDGPVDGEAVRGSGCPVTG
ncbi:hypothetical protein ACPXCE_15630 [Streptomyces sp. DT24]|uniref:hypothetical protein n=1 Tax=unclassified Streptomyces TaxID=2593676 RepID=UPI0023B964CB|nr:hypothetical protein [Streptomyces sp. AM 4-1-1]WEH35111.1 hypothetical protein PZB75_18150 [Streptomyces sp. AM 4-1-1]